MLSRDGGRPAAVPLVAVAVAAVAVGVRAGGAVVRGVAVRVGVRVAVVMVA